MVLYTYAILEARVETIVFYVFEGVDYENLGAFAQKWSGSEISGKFYIGYVCLDIFLVIFWCFS